MNIMSKANEGFNALQNATWRALAEKSIQTIPSNECNYPHVHWS